MKGKGIVKFFWRTNVAAILALGLGTLSAYGQALIYVDVSNPTSVTLTATSNLSSLNDTNFTLYDGFNLVSFFTGDGANYPFGSFITTNFASSLQAGLPYTDWYTDDRSGGTNYLDLNVYRRFGNETQYFSNSAAAFVGTSTIDLSGKSGYLPSPGSTGNIVLGWGAQSPAPVIGQWQAIPEPSTILLVIFGGGAAMFLSRMKHRRR